jgi:monofunctional chorismate mutase
LTYEDEIKPYRETIDRLNDEIIEKLAERQKTALTIGKIKMNYGKPVIDRTREQTVLNKIKDKASAMGLNPEALEGVFIEIIKLCTKAEETL